MWRRRSRIVYIDTRWLFIKITVAVLLAASLMAYWNWTRVTLIRFESAELAASWQVSDSELIKQIVAGLRKAVPASEPAPGTELVVMRLISKQQTKEYTFTNPEFTFDRTKNANLKTPPSLTELLKRAVVELRRRSPYGQMISWEEVQNLFPIGSDATVRDLDTGRGFRVRRSGGYSHALVEPLTARDSAVVKDLYDGRWSWKRRAVIMETGNRKIAASLAGMPQGQGQIKENDCYGAVGLFFASQALAKSNNLAHQVMVWKAAGKTREKLRGLTPEEVLMVLFTAIDQRDVQTLKQIIAEAENINFKDVQNVIGVTVIKMRKKTEDTYQLTVRVSMLRGPYNYNRWLEVQLKKDEKSAVYQVNGDFLLPLLQQSNY